MTETLQKTPESEARVAECEEDLTKLGAQREKAQGAIREADVKVDEIKARQDEISVAVISEEKQACEENGKLEEALLLASRRGATARTALGRLEEQIAQTEEARKKALSEVHRQRFAELRRERGLVDEKIEEAMSSLLESLGQLEDIHREQVAEAYGVSPEFHESVASQPVGITIQSYLGAHLFQYGFDSTAASPRYRTMRMAEADPLATDEQ